MTSYSVTFLRIGADGRDENLGSLNQRLNAATRDEAATEARALRPPEGAEGMKIFFESIFGLIVMPRGPKGERRPADVIGNAVKVMRIAVGEEAEDTPDTGKNKAAQELGKLGGVVAKID